MLDLLKNLSGLFFPASASSMARGITGMKQVIYLCGGQWHNPKLLASSFTGKPA